MCGVRRAAARGVVSGSVDRMVDVCYCVSVYVMAAPRRARTEVSVSHVSTHLSALAALRPRERSTALQTSTFSLRRATGSVTGVTDPTPPTCHKHNHRAPTTVAQTIENNIVMSAGKRSCPDLSCYLLSVIRALDCSRELNRVRGRDAGGCLRRPAPMAPLDSAGGERN